MRLWTVQPVAVWQQVQETGRVCVDPSRVNPEGWVHPQYAWLANQLRTRIAGSRGRLPWFAYCARPDLRGLRHTRPHGSREVLIEFEPPAAAVVAFPCWAWNTVFIGDYLPRNRAEYRGWRDRLTRAGVDPDDELPRPFQAELEASWERLFDLTLPARVPYRDGFPFGATREAVVTVLEKDWVRSVREFVGTYREGHLDTSEAMGLAPLGNTFSP
jgi:hypothetical protein